MLILLNIIIIIFVLGMAALWATYGFFSAFLNLLIVILAGVLALAAWEPLAFWLLGRMPAYAHGVALLAPFALLVILLRALFDKYCKMNLHVPRLADQAGGALCGATAGVLAFGMLLNGAGFLPIERGAMGWAPLAIQGNDVKENEDGQLWSFTRVNDWSGDFFEFLSGGAMSPTGGPSLAEARPGLADRAVRYRAPIDTNQMKSAHPENLKVTGVYSVPASRAAVEQIVARSVVLPFLQPGYELPQNANPGADGRGLIRAIGQAYRNRTSDPEQYGRPSEMVDVAAVQSAARTELLSFNNPTSADNFETFLNKVADQLGGALADKMSSALAEGKQLFIVDTRWNSTQPGAYNPSDNKLRVAIPQVRLQYKQGGELKEAPPVGYSIEYSQNTGARSFTDLVSDQIYAAHSSYSEFSMAWVFALDEGTEPTRFFCRELRFDLSKLETPEGGDSPIVQDLNAIAKVWGAPAPPVPDDELADGTPAANNNNNNSQTVVTGSRLAASGTRAEVSEALPRTFSAASSTSLKTDKATEPWTLIEGADDRVESGRSGGMKSTIREIWVPVNTRLIRLEIDSRGARSLYGSFLGAAEALGVMQVVDAGGNRYDAIGYCLMRNDMMEIDIRGSGASQRGLSASELPNFGQDETLYVYFQVEVGSKIEAYAINDTLQEFETPLDVPEKRRR